MYFSFRWKLLPYDSKIKKHYYTFPVIQVQTFFLDEKGKEHSFKRSYNEWIGVCTNDIHKVIEKIKKKFPVHKTYFEKLSVTKKILPYFEKRLETGKLDYRDKPFYKLYSTACNEDVGRFLNKYKIGYYSKNDWLVRIYIDLCIKYNTHSFYYKWYDINSSDSLLDSYVMHSERTDTPKWKIAAFDIESVSIKDVSGRVPNGTDPNDAIVMISLVKWIGNKNPKQYVLYVEPVKNHISKGDSNVNYASFKTEHAMLSDFHRLIQDCQVLTGHNINSYDLKFIFCRLMWLQLYSLLKDYSSFRCGTSVIITYCSKIIIDTFYYFKTFSSSGLAKYSLDHIAQVRLGEGKIDVKSTGIWSWYISPQELINRHIYNDDVKQIYTEFKVNHIKLQEFGTFQKYLDYCLRDSVLVCKLFRKEDILSFFVQRANFTASDVSIAMYVGNSRFLLELFKTYGTRLGYFFNEHFFKNPIDINKYKFMFIKSSKGFCYQGALNYCKPQTVYEDVSVFDFSSMYPSALYSSNLCFGTCTILERMEWINIKHKYPQLNFIPYRIHNENDFINDPQYRDDQYFAYPKPNADDKLVMVMNPTANAFLPSIVNHFIHLRKFHQAELKKTGDVYHKNVQQCIKILINSLYGIMASKNSCLSYPVIAMIIVTLARYQILGSFHCIRKLGYETCYVDTDSLFIHLWPHNDCHVVNEFLNIPNVELKYEQRLKRLVIMCKKRYIYETLKGTFATKGFMKVVNDPVKYATDRVVQETWKVLFPSYSSEPVETDCGKGWKIWTELILELQYMCRDAHKYSLYKKTRDKEEYKITTCSTYRYLEKYPEKASEYVNLTYGRADIQIKEANKLILDPDDCKEVNFEKFFDGQQKALVTLLNMAFWNDSHANARCKSVLNTNRWRGFVLSEIKNYKNRGRKLTMAVETGKKYTFEINEFSIRGRGRKRKIEFFENSTKINSSETEDENY